MTEAENRAAAKAFRDQSGMKKTLLVVGLVFAIYFPIAWHLQRIYVPIKGPPGSVARLTHITKEAETRFAYYGQIPLGQYKGNVLLFEDDKELGPPNSALDGIRNLGGGRYGLFGKPTFIFSSSDNSNPLENHRHYWVVVR
jgi:hypothetical protein